MVAEAPRDYSARSRRSVQLVAGLGSFIAPFLVASMVVAAPIIGADLGAEVANLAWLTAAFFLAAASLLIPFGRIADVRGSKKVFTVGMAVYIVSGLVCALAPNMAVLIVGRGLCGAGAAMVFGTSIALLSLVFPEQERGEAIGVNVTLMFAGFTTGLLAGGFVSFYLNWRLLFLVAVALAAVNMFLLRTRVKGECELARERGYDAVGMALFSACLLLVFFGLSEVLTDLGRLCLLAGAALAGVLWLRGRRSSRSMIDHQVSRNRFFLLTIVTNIVFQAGSFAVPFLLSLYSQLNLGLDAREASFVLIVPQVLLTATSWASGRALARVGGRLITTTGALLNAVGLFVLVLLPGEISVLDMVVSLSFLGVGTGLFMPALVDWAMGSISRREYGVASAITETARLLGMTVSNVILILVVSVVASSETVQGAGGDLPQVVQLCSLVFLALTLSVVVPSLASRWLGGGQRQPPSRPP